jgi:hypothetical protein
VKAVALEDLEGDSQLFPPKYLFHTPAAIVLLEIHFYVYRLCGLVVGVPGY